MAKKSKKTRVSEICNTVFDERPSVELKLWNFSTGNTQVEACFHEIDLMKFNQLPGEIEKSPDNETAWKQFEAVCDNGIHLHIVAFLADAEAGNG